MSDPPPSLPSTQRRTSGLSGWMKVLIAALVVAVMASVTAAIILALGVHKASTSFNDAVTPKPGRPGDYHGAAYPGMLVQDHVASGAGGSIDVNGETISATGLMRTTGTSTPALCSQVALTNHSLATKDVGPLEWKLQQPNGIVQGFGLTGFSDTLQSGQIAPGGTARGTVCFSDTGQPGRFVLLWQPLVQVGRGVWILPF